MAAMKGNTEVVNVRSLLKLEHQDNNITLVYVLLWRLYTV